MRACVRACGLKPECVCVWERERESKSSYGVFVLANVFCKYPLINVAKKFEYALLGKWGLLPSAIIRLKEGQRVREIWERERETATKRAVRKDDTCSVQNHVTAKRVKKWLETPFSFQANSLSPHLSHLDSFAHRPHCPHSHSHFLTAAVVECVRESEKKAWGYCHHFFLFFFVWGFLLQFFVCFGSIFPLSSSLVIYQQTFASTSFVHLS